MRKSLCGPGRLLAIAMWVVSVAIAGFLIELGRRAIAELPGVTKALDCEQFLHAATVRRSRATEDSLNSRRHKATAHQELAHLLAESTQQEHTSARTRQVPHQR